MRGTGSPREPLPAHCLAAAKVDGLEPGALQPTTLDRRKRISIVLPQQEVGRLDVAVYDILLVAGGDHLERLIDHTRCRALAERAMFLRTVAPRFNFIHIIIRMSITSRCYILICCKNKILLSSQLKGWT